MNSLYLALLPPFLSEFYFRLYFILQQTLIKAIVCMCVLLEFIAYITVYCIRVCSSLLCMVVRSAPPSGTAG